MSEIAPVADARQASNLNLDYDDKKKAEFSHSEEQYDKEPISSEVEDTGIQHLRSKWDDLPYQATLRLFWRGVLVCFLAAFSSFTDGYQVCYSALTSGSQITRLLDCSRWEHHR